MRTEMDCLVMGNAILYKEEQPSLRQINGRQVACHFAEELDLRGFDYEKA